MAMNIWPFLFIRKECENKITEEDLNHEEIHSCQQIEILLPSLILSLVSMCMGYGWASLLIIPLFLWWYLIEWGVKCLIYNDSKKAYKEIGFEKEAYTNEKNLSYISRRKHFAWFSYI
jgi:hypothetical protein